LPCRFELPHFFSNTSIILLLLYCGIKITNIIYTNEIL
jgi:hypothetical protein